MDAKKCIGSIFPLEINIVFGYIKVNRFHINSSSITLTAQQLPNNVYQITVTASVVLTQQAERIWSSFPSLRRHLSARFVGDNPAAIVAAHSDRYS